MARNRSAHPAVPQLREPMTRPAPDLSPSEALQDAPVGRGARRVALAGYLLVMMLLFLVPIPHRFDAIARRYDGLVHLLLFLVFAVVYRLDGGPGPGRTLVMAVLLAGGTELAQWVLPYRGAQWSDFAMGAAGAAIGIAISLLAARWPTGTNREPGRGGPANEGAG